MSDLQHRRYIGGGAALSALTRWEADEAAAELTGAKSGQTTRIAADFTPQVRSQSVVAAQLLNDKEVKEITGFDGNFETGPLGDEPDTSAYSSQHFKALGRPQSFDIALRLWKLSADGAEKRYADITELLPKVDKVNEIADQSFRASEGSIFAVGFLDRRLGAVLMLTCGQAQCDSEEAVVKLARTAHESLKRLMPAKGTK